MKFSYAISGIVVALLLSSCAKTSHNSSEFKESYDAAHKLVPILFLNTNPTKAQEDKTRNMVKAKWASIIKVEANSKEKKCFAEIGLVDLMTDRYLQAINGKNIHDMIATLWANDYTTKQLNKFYIFFSNPAYSRFNTMKPTRNYTSIDEMLKDYQENQHLSASDAQYIKANMDSEVGQFGLKNQEYLDRAISRLSDEMKGSSIALTQQFIRDHRSEILHCTASTGGNN